MNEIIVTPCVGVWIEIKRLNTVVIENLRHSLRGSVDWNFVIVISISRRVCHFQRGSVDRNNDTAI